MPRRLPPLNALRAFDAAARCGSFTRAAQDLCVTQGAVSRHVATLEDWLGLRLFERAPQSTGLTSAGHAYYATVRNALDQIELGTRLLQQNPDERRLRIKLPPTFAVRWFVPRLARFHARHPRIDVQITTSHHRVDFAREAIDIGVHSEPRMPQGPGYRRLFGETLLPVCAPGLPAQEPPLRVPSDLRRHVLLSSMNRPHDWPTWLAAAGVDGIDGNQGLQFENAALAYQAAAERVGVMVGLEAFVRDDLAAGRLVAPFGLRVQTPGAYFLQVRDDVPQPQRVRDFVDWIVEEATAAAAPPS